MLPWLTSFLAQGGLVRMEIEFPSISAFVSIIIDRLLSSLTRFIAKSTDSKNSFEQYTPFQGLYLNLDKNCLEGTNILPNNNIFEFLDLLYRSC